MINLLNILLLVWIFSLNCFGQSRIELEKKRKSLGYQINKTNQLLSKASVSKKTAQQNIHVLKVQIDSKQALIVELGQELDSSDYSIDRKIAVIEALEIDLSKLKANYKKMIRLLYRHAIDKSKSSFHFASNRSNKDARSSFIPINNTA